VTALALAAVCVASAPAGAAPEPGAFRAGDYGGFRNVLPPGSNGLANGLQLGAFLSTGMRPPHNDDQLRMYGDLVYASPGLRPADLGKYFKDASFGVPAGQEERRYSPRDDVTIVRDSAFGVPHIYGATRDGAMFGIGYTTAEDRLFFIDVLRHLGRAQLSSFVGGAPGNRAFDAEQWAIAPYTEADLERQTQLRPRGYEAESDRLRQDLRNYVAGVNQYIAEARLDPSKMPGEYPAIGRPQGPDDWRGSDAVAIASLVGGIFGTGGGRELDSALVLESARKRFGRVRGPRVWRDFRSAEDPEAPTTVRGRSFPYEVPPRRRAAGSLALPDTGSVRREQTVVSSTASTTDARASRGASGFGRPLAGLLGFPGAQSNALLVSARESRSGRPLAVFGPQTAYFAPEVLMEQDVHAPGLDARGVAFPGTNLFVQLGRGRDYAWSATSAGQDVVDTWALDLCEPGKRRPTIESDHYLYHGRCTPMEALERTNEWTPNLADQTPAGSETLRTYRTKLGLVVGRATIRGKPVAYARLRTTYGQETSSGLGFSYYNSPGHMRGPRDFQRNAYLLAYTFNWFYVDDKHIAYFNSGTNPVRAPGIDPNLPARARKRFEWKNWDPSRHTASYTPARTHPQLIDQSYITSWNNKQARGHRASDAEWGYGPVYRSTPLDDRIRPLIRGSRKATLTELVDAMAGAATVDLRGDSVLPWALRVLRAKLPVRVGGRTVLRSALTDPAIAGAVKLLESWRRAGSHRLDRNRDDVYEHTDAIRVMDAWWPRWVRAQFRPVLGSELFARIQRMIEFSNDPNNHGEHLGSAWQNGWYGYAQKDLRAVLGRRVRGRYSRRYCGRGSLRRCQQALATALKAALRVDSVSLYSGDPVCEEQGRSGDQWCWDAVWFRPLGGVTQPLLHWVNRPTFQQVVQVQGHRPR
jgi:acyl-homoserine lactone acylase PvdQ